MSYQAWLLALKVSVCYTVFFCALSLVIFSKLAFDSWRRRP